MGFEGAAGESKTPSAEELAEQKEQEILNKISGMTDIAKTEEILSKLKENIVIWTDIDDEKRQKLEKRKDLMERRIQELKEENGEKTENLRFRLAREFKEGK